MKTIRDYTDRIAYIVPNDTMVETTKEILKEDVDSGLVDVMTIDVYHILSEYRRLCSEGYGYIIARGGTYRELNKVADSVPVMEERIWTADIIEILHNMHKAGRGPIYLIIHENNARGIDKLPSIVDFDLKLMRYETLEQLREQILGIREPNAAVLTSGVAQEISGREDLEFVELWNRPVTIKGSVRTAKTVLRQMKDNLQRINVLDSVYNNVEEGIVIFDMSNTIREMNMRAEKYLGVRMDDAVGSDVYDLIDEMPARRNDGSCSIETPRTFLGIRSNGNSQMHLTYSVYPFMFDRDEQRFLMTIQDITRVQEAERSIRMELAKKGLTAQHTFEDILTQDPAMMQTVESAKLIAQYNGSVLIYGESGTGKELIAQSIHNASTRANGPFVAINCGALTESLLESELFGYVGGSFTGARKEGKAGLFELAHQGTIFLDEINSMPLNLQTKILRVIEAQEVMRVGSDYVIPLDVRIISASNENLRQEMIDGKFRRDLFFRLNTFHLAVPPIRERKGDIQMLFEHYLDQFDEDHVGVPPLTPEFRQALLDHRWLGNVREIKSVALRYIAYDGDNSHGNIIPKESAWLDAIAAPMDPVDKTGSASSANSGSAEPVGSSGSLLGEDHRIDLKDLTSTIEQLVIQQLEGQGMSRSDIAKTLGISRQALYKKLK